MDSTEAGNCYALVFYASGRLAEFLDALRAELEPDRPAPRAHVTVLPPRPIARDAEAAIGQLRRHAPEFLPFQAGMGEIDTFKATNVVYLSVTDGLQNLQSMHDRLNQDALEYEEPFRYHPHITLAQGLTPEQMPAVLELARKRWREYTGPRAFDCASWFFVRGCGTSGTRDLRWADLAEIKLS